MLKTSIMAGIGIAGSFIMQLFGGWNATMNALVCFMAVDLVTGLMSAGVFKTSKKSATGCLDSRAMLKGLIKKGSMLLFILVAAQLDVIMQTTFIRDAMIIAFCANELLSIVENAGCMGIRFPQMVTNAIEQLQRQQGDKT